MEHAAPEDLRQVRDHALVAETEMAVAAEEAFDQKVVEELHVGSGEPDRRIDSVVERSAAFELLEPFAEPLPHVARQIDEHLAEMAVFELQHVDVHKQPVVGMVGDQLFDAPSEARQILSIERVTDLVEHGPQPGVDHLLVARDDRFKNRLLGPVVVVQVAKRCASARGDVAHRGGMKASLDEKLLGCFLDSRSSFLNRLLTQFRHRPRLQAQRLMILFETRARKENERSYFIRRAPSVNI